ncbi:MAG TPA: hypothetical protein VFJ77_04010 [Gaiellaceae bacterium]|nr:hypothetical protein [Gaiellaceae bacterium]
MSRKRLVALATAAAALAAASVAGAAHHRSQSSQAAAATFAATTVSHTHSRTCTGGDGAYTDTTATYAGTAASGDARLAGTLTIRAHSVVASDGLGWLDGTFRTSGGTHGNVHAALAGGHAVGTLVGNVRKPEGKLVASFSSDFTPAGGFGSGQLGSGSAAGAGIVFQRGTCTKPHKTRSVSVSHLKFRASGPVRHRADGSFTLDVTRDANGGITSANAVFYVNYRFGAPATISGLALHQGAKGQTGAVVVDAAPGTIVDADGNGNLTRQVAVSGATAQAVLANPRGYYVELTTADSSLRAQLGGFSRR